MPVFVFLVFLGAFAIWIYSYDYAKELGDEIFDLIQKIKELFNEK